MKGGKMINPLIALRLKSELEEFEKGNPDAQIKCQAHGKDAYGFFNFTVSIKEPLFQKLVDSKMIPERFTKEKL